MVCSCSVYGLASSRDGAIRYVGQTTKSVDRRFAKHLENARLGIRSHLYNWIRGEISSGHQVFPKVLCDSAIWGETEMETIASFKMAGIVLVNATAGGDGTLGWRHNDESKAKMLAKRVGKKLRLTEEARAKRSAQAKAMSSNSEVRAKIALSLTGNKLASDSIAKRTATRIANGNYTLSEEQKLARSQRMRSWWAERRAS